MNKSKVKIIETAIDLLQERGINGFSFSDVAEIVGIKKASIFYYFSSKLDLVKEALDYYNTQFFKELNRRNQESKSLIDFLTSYCSLYEDNLKNNKICLCSMLITESFSLNESLIQEINNFFNRNIEWLESTFNSFIADREISKLNANQFLVTVQGVQIISRSLGDIAYFNKITSQKINNIEIN
ncbi:TPA: TetR/AcrR family transcriptional regulator [Listeria monocytogenes]